MGELGRQLVTLVEIDVGRCTRTYGVAPCTAALSAATQNKCVNARKTCQDIPNYDEATLTLRFGPNITGLPDEATVFPALTGEPRVDAGELNLSGIDPRTGPLGKRDRVTVALQDFTYHETLTDPYRDERISGAAQFDSVPLDPSQGTFFAKQVERIYYQGRPLRVRRGRVGAALSTFTSEHFVISEWNGPNAKGAVTLVAKDILDLVDNAKAVAPQVSRGRASVDFTAAATSITLVPSGIGAEYAASGVVCVGRELIRFTRSGDVLTLTRGIEGTTAAAHTAKDVVQQCLVYTDIAPCDAIADLLLTYGGVDAAFVDTAAWQDENSWAAGLGLTTIIPRPTGVATLVGEINQLGNMSWWDRAAQEVRYRVNRPQNPDETITTLTDEGHFLNGSPDVERDEAKRIGAMLVWHGVIDYTDFAADGTKFKSVAPASNAGVADPTLEDQDSIKSIFTRWFGREGNDGAASILAERLASRYEKTPLIFTAVVDMEHRDSVKHGALVRVQSRVIQDALGRNLPTLCQINRAPESGDRIDMRAESYAIEGRFGFWLDDPTDDYDAPADDADIAFGAYWMDDGIGTFPDGTGPYLYF